MLWIIRSRDAVSATPARMIVRTATRDHHVFLSCLLLRWISGSRRPSSPREDYAHHQRLRPWQTPWNPFILSPTSLCSHLTRKTFCTVTEAARPGWGCVCEVLIYSPPCSLLPTPSSFANTPFLNLSTTMRSSVIATSSVNASFNTSSRNVRIVGREPELYLARGTRPVKACECLKCSSSLSSRLYRPARGSQNQRVTKSSPD